MKIEPNLKGSKFVFDSHNMTLLWGKLPKKDGQLWRGENHQGLPMEMAGNSDEPDCPTPYWGWSS